MVALHCNLTGVERNAAVFGCVIYATVCGAVHAAAYRANAISLRNWCKTEIGCHFQNAPKTTSDLEKTMSYAGKIMSDIV